MGRWQVMFEGEQLCAPTGGNGQVSLPRDAGEVRVAGMLGRRWRVMAGGARPVRRSG